MELKLIEREKMSVSQIEKQAKRNILLNFESWLLFSRLLWRYNEEEIRERKEASEIFKSKLKCNKYNYIKLKKIFEH